MIFGSRGISETDEALTAFRIWKLSGLQPTILVNGQAEEEGLVASVYDEDPDETLEGYTFEAYLGLQGVLKTRKEWEGKHKAQLQVVFFNPTELRTISPS